jgi:hypothetical protein
MHLYHIFMALRHARAQISSKNTVATVASFDPGPRADNHGPKHNDSIRYSRHLTIETRVFLLLYYGSITCILLKHAISH